MALNFLSGLVVGSVGCHLLNRLLVDRRKPKTKKEIVKGTECLLYSPFQAVWNSCSMTSKQFCDLLTCPFCNYKKFIIAIGKASSTVDVCVYLITSPELTNLLISLFKRGVAVRIITDKQMSVEGQNSKLSLFLKENLPIKVIEVGDIMHNKFVIIDKKTLVTGSFNWTKQAVNRNFENAILLTDVDIVNKYLEYFQYMWMLTK